MIHIERCPLTSSVSSHCFTHSHARGSREDPLCSKQTQSAAPTVAPNPPSPHMTNEFNYPFYVLHPLPPILKFSLPSTGPLLTALPVTALKTSTKDFVVGNTPDGQTALNSQTKRLSWATVNWLTASSSVGGSSGGGAGTSNSSES